MGDVSLAITRYCPAQVKLRTIINILFAQLKSRESLIEGMFGLRPCRWVMMSPYAV